MLASRRDVLPLPPAAENGETQLQIMTGLTHLIFVHNDPQYSALARNLAEVSDRAKTLAILPGGVLIGIADGKGVENAEDSPATPVAGDTPILPEGKTMDH